MKPATLYSKPELDELIQQLKAGDEDAVYECIVFTLAESFGIWHNRAGAKNCRNLKNHPPDPTFRHRLVEVIIERLRTGRFYEQFKDQLTMAIRFDRDRLRAAADQLQDDDREYIRRYATWVLHAIDSAPNPTMRKG